MARHFFSLLCFLGCLVQATFSQSVPGLINYQGRVAVGGVNFDGSGQFKFALVNGDGTFTHWSNDGTFGGEPAAAVTIPVVKGLYAVLLGDTNLPNMQSITPLVFQNEDVRLRVWFNDGTHGFQQLTPDQRIAATGYAMMAASVPDGSINQSKLAPGAVTGASIQPGSITSTHLSNGAVQAQHMAAGAVTREAIADGAVSGAKISDGAVSTRQIAAAAIGGESWIATPNPEDGPVGRTGHSVIWTGTEFIIWGGVANVFGGPAVSNTGARYNPATDTWINITLTGAPSARRSHTAVWTGAEMIVWGGTTALDGESGGLNSGGRYNPTTNTWINTGGGIGLPPGRRNHTAVWTGTDMIIWGGLDAGSNFLGDGSKLNGGTNVWSGIAVDDAPEVRHSHTAAWTGSKMVIWGGIGPSGPDNTGNVYDAASNVWAATPMPLTGAPTGRSGHSMVWTGTDMIVWGGAGASAQPVTGGTSFQFQNGGRYRVTTNSWHPMSATGVPAHRTRHTAVWTGHEMLIWGGSFATDLGGGTNVAGSLDDGAVYIPESDTWRPMAQEGAPAARTEHTAAWTGREMIVWGGNGQGNLLNTGGRYRLSLIANGAVGARQLADGAVGSGQLADGAVGSQQLASGAVQASNIADGAVGSVQLGMGAVGSANLQVGAVTGASLANGSITNAKLAAESVDTGNLAEGAIGPNQMQSQAVTSLALAAGAVTADKIFNGQVTEPKLAAGAVTTTKIADGAVTKDKLALGAIGELQIADGAIQARHLAAGSVGSEMLAKPPQAGVTTLNMGNMRFGQMEFTVEYPTPYSTPPVVTTSAQGVQNRVLVTVTSTTTTGFSGVASLTQDPVSWPIAQTSGNDFPINILRIPSYLNTLVYYDPVENRGWSHYTLNDRFGDWTSESTSPSISLSTDLAASNRLVDVTIHNASGNYLPRYVWASPSQLCYGSQGFQGSDGIVGYTIIDSGTFTDVSCDILADKPGVAYRDVANQDLKFARGIVGPYDRDWGTPVVLDAEGSVGKGAQLKTIGAFSYITYYREDAPVNFKCVRSLDGAGAEWSVPVSIPLDEYGPDHSLGEINGRPAIAYLSNFGRSISLSKATTSEATVWSEGIILADFPEADFNTLEQPNLQTANNQIVVTFRYRPEGSLYIVIGDIHGQSWSSPLRIAWGGETGHRAIAVSRGGQITVIHHDLAARQIQEVRERSPMQPFQVNWIALPQ